jgi:hypothetical protein
LNVLKGGGNLYRLLLFSAKVIEFILIKLFTLRLIWFIIKESNQSIKSTWRNIMATIKKAYATLIGLLEANTTALVSDILPQAIELAAAKTGSGGGKATAFHRNEEGEVVAIKCYYHKLWMDPRVVEFGKKTTSPTGLNNMCKDGVSKWTKQQRDAKTAEANLLSLVAAGEVAVEDIAAKQLDISAATDLIVAREDGYGFETLDECLADSETRGL